MNTKNLKAYAPKARSQFIEAIKKRAAQFGIYQDKIAEVQFEGGSAIIEGRAFTKKQGEQRKSLERKINANGLATHKERFELFIREMAYTWFNRLAAIRYMELHDYLDHGFRVLSPAKGNPTNANSFPEILDHASDVVDTLDPDQKYLDKNHIIELQLAGNKEEELYRELLLGQCHRLYNIIPFMFEAIDDATELLLPDNLTKTDSILKGLVNEIPEEDWSEIEVIGWLYQFYISEHKDAVIGKVVKSEDIPAATQLFTPNWIVKYLVQNSLGRQWLATYPESELKGKMEYYIEPAEQSDDVIEQLKAITPTSIDPEQIKVLDPAAGSGHILVEVYEILREIYLERGYRLREIPELILTKNIYGLDIDDRAAQLAGFALMMKAREDDRRIFQRVEDGEVSLNVYSLQSTEGLDIPKLWQALNLEGNQQQGTTGGLFEGLCDGLGDESDGFIQPTGVYNEYFELLQTLKSAFSQAKTLGSLIQIDNCHLQNLVALKELLQAKEKGSDPSAKQAATDLLPVVNQAIALAQHYDVVVANPPYMGSKGMNSDLKGFTKKQFPNSKSDLFSIYIERCISFGVENSEIGMLTPFVWMFLSSYEKLRSKLISENTLSSLIQLEYNAFAPACIPVCTFTISKKHVRDYIGDYIRLSDFKGHENQSPRTLEAIKNKKCEWFYNSKPENFKTIPGCPIAYWVSENIFNVFSSEKSIGEFVETRQGLGTGNDEEYFRLFWEVDFEKFGLGYKSSEDGWLANKKWFPLNKGGSFRKWYGNQEFVIAFDESNRNVLKTIGNHLPSERLYFKKFVSWSDVTSSTNSFRAYEDGFLFSNTGHCAFPEDDMTSLCLSYANNSFVNKMTKILNPTMHFHIGYFNILPFPSKMIKHKSEIKEIVDQLVNGSKLDWDSGETSWSFVENPLVKISTINKLGFVSDSYQSFKDSSEKTVKEFCRLESLNNEIFISAYGLEGEIDSSIAQNEITLRQNKYNRYKKIDTVEELDNRYRSDSIAELLSYSLGNMMGRFSLDRDGLVYANSGNKGFNGLVTEGVYNTFPADDDGIVPLASEEWLFGDDATARFKEFVKTVWGEDNLQENLEFVSESLCLHALKPAKNESANDTVRRYFSKQFYKDHCKTYKKRPIYWLFSSGKEKAFECLVYLHRYNEGTLSRMRTEYVTPLMGKYEAQHSLLAEQKLEATTTEARRIEKELKSLEKKQAELRIFDEQLKHYAEMRITLDLDDGVKANYGKFGNLLADVKAIHGKAVK